MSLFAADLPEPVEPTVMVTITSGTHGDVATRVVNAATAAGLPAQRSAKLAAAVDEVASAGTRNSGAPVTIRLWQDRTSLVCEVRDHGTIEDLLVGRGPALSTQSRDRGIRLANELCDLVQVRSNRVGTAVRMHSWL
jgi:anti-sigma regulatory factor (Ser/Thr protein kinase)